MCYIKGKLIVMCLSSHLSKVSIVYYVVNKAKMQLLCVKKVES